MVSVDTTSASSSPASAHDRALAELNEATGLHLRDPHLLRAAVAYPTSARDSDHPDVRQNERLEFLGDSVIGTATADYLFRTFPDLPEGDLTSMRSALVSASTQSAWARHLRLERWLGFDSSPTQPGERNVERLLAMLFEALMGALYLEQGPEGVARFLQPLLDRWAQELPDRGRGPKNRLQELSQEHGGPTPVYRLVEQMGPPHARLYRVEVMVSDDVLGAGVGRSKRAAETAAAEQAIGVLEDRLGHGAAGRPKGARSPAGRPASPTTRKAHRT